MAALEKKAQHVYILNRTLSRAQAIATEVNALAGYEFATALELQDYVQLAGRKYLCIQATSVGLFPKVDEVVLEDSAFYDMVHTGYDLIYNPYETRFMSLVKEHGGQAFNGLKMLLYQGIIAYELWNQISVSEEIAQRILDRMKEALGLS
jgi:shikimate dehydrogenase